MREAVTFAPNASAFELVFGDIPGLRQPPTNTKANKTAQAREPDILFPIMWGVRSGQSLPLHRTREHESAERNLVSVRVLSGIGASHRVETVSATHQRRLSLAGLRDECRSSRFRDGQHPAGRLKSRAVRLAPWRVWDLPDSQRPQRSKSAYTVASTSPVRIRQGSDGEPGEYCPGPAPDQA